MTNFDTIKAYDSGNGNGTIVPEPGEELVHFAKSDPLNDDFVRY